MSGARESLPLPGIGAPGRSLRTEPPPASPLLQLPGLTLPSALQRHLPLARMALKQALPSALALGARGLPGGRLPCVLRGQSRGWLQGALCRLASVLQASPSRTSGPSAVGSVLFRNTFWLSQLKWGLVIAMRVFDPRARNPFLIAPGRWRFSVRISVLSLVCSVPVLHLQGAGEGLPLQQRPGPQGEDI